MKRVCCLLAALCILLTGLVSFAFAASYPAEAVVNAQDVRVRKEMKSNAASLAKLKKGTVVTVTDEAEDEKGNRWYAMVTPKGKEGFMLAEFLSVREQEYIDAAESSPLATKMNISIHASCSDYKGLPKNGWVFFYEINGIAVEKGQHTAILAPDVPMTVMARVKNTGNNNARGELKMEYTPTAEEISGGFIINQTVTAVSGKGKQVEWLVTYVFAPSAATVGKTDKTEQAAKTDKATATPLPVATPVADPDSVLDPTGEESSGEEEVFTTSRPSAVQATTQAVVVTPEPEREVDHYETREVQKTRRVVDHYDTYTARELQPDGTVKDVEKQKAVYRVEHYTETVQVPIYK